MVVSLPIMRTSLKTCATLWSVHLAAVARYIGHRGTVAKIAGRTHGEDRRRARCFMAALQMLGADVFRGEYRNERRRSRSAFDIGAPTGFFPLDQAEHTGNLETVLARRLDGLNSGGAGGTNVIYDDHPRREVAKAFKPLAGAVRLLRLAHQKSVHRPALLRADH